MGGKTSTSTSSVAIPPEVLARYNSVNKRAEAVATQPFQKYSTDPNAFVAPLNQQQYAGIGGINQAANMAQPYYGAGAQMTLAGAGSVMPEQYSGQAVQQYMSPYISNVANTTAAQMGNLFGQQAEELKGGAIRAGAFGGDRSGIAQGNLANQQALAYGQQMANIYNTGFGQAQQQFNQQQGVNLAAEQANQQRLLAAGQQLGGLGGAAQAAAMQGAQAQLGAGTLEQQTQQAGQTALYNQFLQQQAYPFQIAQFLANIAMGTGALSGSTQTTTQPAPFFSDKNVKDNIEPIGETYDGQKIVKFNYKGNKQKQIGLIAQDVERHHPEAVGLAGGIKTVDYDGATRDAARMGKYMGGLASEGGAVNQFRAGQGFAVGGIPESVNTAGLQNTINQQMAAPAAAPPGGINQAVAAEAQALAPKPVIPESVNAPVFNPQPIPGSDKSKEILGKFGKDKSAGSKGPEFTNWSDYLAGLAAGKDMNDPSLRPAQGAETPDPIKDFMKNFYGENRADGGRIGFATYGGVDEALARQAQMYAALDQSHIPTSRQLTTGISKHGRLPEANLPVSRLVGPDADIVKAHSQQTSALEEGLGAYEKGAKIAEVFTKVREGLAKLGSSAGTTSPSSSGAASSPSAPPPAATPKPDAGLSGAETDTSAYVSPEFEEEGLGSFGFAKKGGRIKRDSGGEVPYTDEETSSKKIEIPTEMPEVALPKHNTPSGSSGSSDLSTLIALGKMVIPFLPFEQGGRINKDNGGPTEGATDPTDLAWQKIIQLESGGKHFDKNGRPLTSPKGAVGIAQVMPTTAPEAARMAGMPFDENRYMNDEKYNAALGKAYFGHQLKTFGDAEKAAAAYNAGPGRVSNAMKKASETGADWRAFLPKETRAYIAKFSGEGELPRKNASNAELQVDVSKYVPQPETEAKPAAEPEKGLASKIGMNEDTLVPLLAGVGSMLSSRSPYLASAIGEGMVGGVGAYTGLKGLKAEVAQREAQTEETFANIARNSAVFSPKGELFVLTVGPSGYQWMSEMQYRDALDSNNPPKIDPRGQNWKANNLPPPPFVKGGEESKAPGLGGAPATPPSGATTEGLGGGEKVEPVTAPEATATEAPMPSFDTRTSQAPEKTETPPAEEPSIPKPTTFVVDKTIEPVVAQTVKEVFRNGPGFAAENYDDFISPAIDLGNRAEKLQDGLMLYAAKMSMRPRTDELMTPGTFAPILHNAFKAVNNIASNFGLGEPISPKDIDNQGAILKKYAELRNQATQAGDQRALGALQKFEEQFPGLGSTHGESAINLANIIVDNRRETMLRDFANSWASTAKKYGATLPKLTGAKMIEVFNERYGDTFQRDRESFKKLYETVVTEDGTPKGKPVMSPMGRPYTWLSYLQEQGQNLSPKQVEWAAKTFGPNILTYFPNLRIKKGVQ